MIRIKEEIKISQELDKLIGDKTIFMDIETTGFSRKNARIYLIGFLFKLNGKYTFFQLMTEKQSEEKELLREFSQILESFDFLITYNGDSFDIPFIKARAEKYFIPIDFESLKSIDIYKDIRSRGFLLDLENYQLNTIERYLGIYREDVFSGGDLIQLYYEFENTGDKRLREFLLLHNKEDILNLPNLIKIYDIIDEKNSIYVDDKKFIIDKLSVQQKGLALAGRSTIGQAYMSLSPYKLLVDDNIFELNGSLQKGKYDQERTCLYIEKNGMELKCSYNIDSPDQILILKYDKDILYKNVVNFAQKLIIEMFK